MSLLPFSNYTQTASIVANTAVAINDEIAAKATDGFILTQFIDKPATDQVYLLFAKNEPIIA